MNARFEGLHELDKFGLVHCSLQSYWRWQNEFYIVYPRTPQMTMTTET